MDEDSVSSLRMTAAHARELARVLNDPEERDVLRQMADELDAAADLLEYKHPS